MLFLDISWQTSPGQSFLILEHYLFQWESIDVSVMVVKTVGHTKDEVQAKMTKFSFGILFQLLFYRKCTSDFM